MVEITVGSDRKGEINKTTAHMSDHPHHPLEEAGIPNTPQGGPAYCAQHGDQYRYAPWEAKWNMWARLHHIPRLRKPRYTSIMYLYLNRLPHPLDSAPAPRVAIGFCTGSETGSEA